MENTAPPPPPFLPLPSTPPVSLPRQELPVLLPEQLPLRAPASSSSSSSLLLRAFASSRLGVGLRKFSVDLGQQLISDPWRLGIWWKTISSRRYHNSQTPNHLVTPPELSVEFPNLRELLHALATSAKAEGVVMVAALLLLLLHAGRPRIEEGDEEEVLLVLERRLPAFVRQGVAEIVGVPPLPRRRLPPLRIPMALLRAAADVGVSKGTEKDESHKDGPRKTDQAISRDATEEIHKDGLQTEQASSSVPTVIQSEGRGKGPDDRFCMKVCSQLKDFSECFSDFGVENNKTSLSELEKTVLEGIPTDAESVKKRKGTLKTEYTKFEATHDKVCTDNSANVLNLKDTCSKSEHQNERLAGEAEGPRKENSTRSELVKTVSDNIAVAGVSTKKMPQGDDTSST